jgi:hypothetical protein
MDSIGIGYLASQWGELKKKRKVKPRTDAEKEAAIELMRERASQRKCVFTGVPHEILRQLEWEG